MKPFVAHAVLVAFIVCSNGSQAFESHLSSSEEIKPWWQPLKSTLEPFENKPTILNPWWKHLKTRTKPSESKYTTLNPWWKHLKTTTKPFENKPTSLNPWWRFLRQTEKTFRKRDETTYPWWRHLRTTQKPFRKRDQTTYSWWKLFRRTEKPFLILRQDYRDSYGHNRESNQHTGHLSSLEVIEPWWKSLEKTTKPYRKKDDWRKPASTTEMPYWKTDPTPYPDSDGNKRKNHDVFRNHDDIDGLITIAVIVLGCLVGCFRACVYDCCGDNEDTCVSYLYRRCCRKSSPASSRSENPVEIRLIRNPGAVEEFSLNINSSNRNSESSRVEAPSDTSSNRNSGAPGVFSISSSSVRWEPSSSETNGRSSSNRDSTSDRPPEYSAVVLDDFVDGDKNFPTVQPTATETPPPKYNSNFLPKY